MMTQQAHLQVMTNNPTIYEQNSFILFQKSCVHKVSRTDGDHYYVPPSQICGDQKILNCCILIGINNYFTAVNISCTSTVNTSTDKSKIITIETQT